MPRPVRGRNRPTSSKAREKGASLPASSPVATAEVQARLPELLALASDADVLAQFESIAAETPGDALALINVLGASREEAAGPVLSAIAADAPAREQRKAARRALHRLRSIGVALAVPIPIEPPAAPLAPVEALPPTQAYVTPSDGVGSRILWLLIERPLGGMTTLSLAINDIVGVKGVMVEETTRRRFDRRLQEWNEVNQRQLVDVPVEYGLSLLSEALALNAESGFPVPREFVIRRPLLGELPPRPPMR